MCIYICIPGTQKWVSAALVDDRLPNEHGMGCLDGVRVVASSFESWGTVNTSGSL